MAWVWFFSIDSLVFLTRFSVIAFSKFKFINPLVARWPNLKIGEQIIMLIIYCLVSGKYFDRGGYINKSVTILFAKNSNLVSRHWNLKIILTDLIWFVIKQRMWILKPSFRFYTQYRSIHINKVYLYYSKTDLKTINSFIIYRI